MHTDARTLDDGRLIDGDLCIVGAGAAGISMALDWADRSERVILLEGGGFEVSSEMQALYENANSGREYYPLESARLHFFGGTTGHWGGLCTPFDPIDFAERDWVPHSGWPIGREDLAPYYRDAAGVLRLPSPNWDPNYWANRRSGAPLAVDEDRWRTKMWQWSGGAGPPVRFGSDYRTEIEQADNIHLFTHANVCNIVANESGSRVEELTVRHFNGDEQTVRAPHIVLACGAVQNARLMLASNDQVPVGLGNEHDQVGRHFMEHVEIDSARLVVPEAQSLPFYQLSSDDGQSSPAWGLLQPTRHVQEKRKTLNGAVRFNREAVKSNDAFTFDDFPEDARKILAFIEKSDAESDSTGANRSFPELTRFQLNTRMEQAPDPASRVTLSEETDALGVPRADLHWTLSEQDKRSIRVINEAVGQELGRIGLGRVQLMRWLRADDASWPDFLTGGWHHMGTLRMAERPENGVVDENCRVHGVDNLHVASSAVFSTGSCANPTLTIVALSLRLSDHLKGIVG